MADDMSTIRNRARIGLALSIVVGIGAVIWFWHQGSMTRGIIAGLLFFGIGAWEYQRRLRTEGRAGRVYRDPPSEDDRDRK